ncbi:hypothetical protein TeGR_g8237, partial [Tetraparma gracilis]
MHPHPLSLTSPASLFPSSPGWSCDSCAATAPAAALAHVCRAPGCNWVLCRACFSADACEGAQESRRPPSPPVSPGRARELAAQERARHAQEQQESERLCRMQLLSGLTDMGFPGSTSERMIDLAMSILGAEEVRVVRRRVMTMAVDFLTNGEAAIAEARREREL